MPRSILSQGLLEEDALLHALTKAFWRALGALNEALERTQVEGPHLERLEDDLARAISPEAFAVAAELGGCELLLAMPAGDAQELGEKFGEAPLGVVEKLSQMWTGQLAEELGTAYTVYRGQRVDLGALNPPGGSRAHLARYFFQLEGKQLGFYAVFQCFAELQALAARPGGAQIKGQGGTRAIKSQMVKGTEVEVSKAVFTPIGELDHVEQEQELRLLEDIDLTITVELGRTTLTLKEILELKPQSVIRLEKLAGEPVDVFVNNNKVARGEVVVLEDNFGVRILEIVPKSKRVQE